MSTYARPSLFTSSSQSRRANGSSAGAGPNGAQPAQSPTSFSDAVSFSKLASAKSQPARGGVAGQKEAQNTDRADSTAASAKATTTKQAQAAESVTTDAHPLKHTWVFYFAQRANAAKSKNANKQQSQPGAAPATGNENADGALTAEETVTAEDKAVLAAKEKESREEWEGTLHTIGSFSSAEAMHPFLAHLISPSQLSSSPTPASEGEASEDKRSKESLVTDLHLFKSPTKPLWEDERNLGGGRWVLRLRKGVSDRIWEDVMFALVGETICPGDHARSKVNGAVLSVRKDEDILSIWCAPSSRADRDHIREGIRAVLEQLMPTQAAATVQLDYKPHPVSPQHGNAGSYHHHRGEHRDRDRQSNSSSHLNGHGEHGHRHHRERDGNERDRDREGGHRERRTGFASYTPRGAPTAKSIGEGAEATSGGRELKRWTNSQADDSKDGGGEWMTGGQRSNRRTRAEQVDSNRPSRTGGW